MKYRRIDGPAFEDGTKQWWVNGKLHRWVNGKLHRKNGTAIEYKYKEWWVEGIQYSEEEFNKKVSEMNSF